MTSADSAAGPASHPGRVLARLSQVREFAPLGALLLICGEIALREPRFLDGANLEQVLLSATLVCIVALGRGLSSSPGRSISRSAPWSRPALSWPPSVYLAIRS